MSPIVPGKSYRLDLSARGYQVLFHIDETNHCPGCGRSQWLVGRVTAECVFCSTALPLAESELAALNPAGHRAVALHVIEGTPKRAAHRDKRRDVRDSAAGRTVALHLDGSPHAFALQNISAGGVMGPALPGITGAASLMIELEDGTMLAAELRWTDGEAAGLAFLMPQTL
ncbi:MAG TPA: hypothetical protein VM055_04450 [Novosphingobium sp.]|nr:hypothetical protein [Novosphingobium sp.]